MSEYSSFKLCALEKEAAVSLQFEIQSLNVLYIICNEYDITVYEDLKTKNLKIFQNIFWLLTSKIKPRFFRASRMT